MISKRTRSKGKAIVALATIFVFSACATAPKTEITHPTERMEAKGETRLALAANRFHAPPAQPPSRSKEVPFVHKVRWKGETLFQISKWYTGSPYNWKAIAAANPGLDPDRILIDDDIVIPKELLKNRKPLAKEALPSFEKKNKVSPAPYRPKSPSKIQTDAKTASKSAKAAPPNPEPMLEPIPASGFEDEPGEIDLFGPVDPD